MVAAAMGWLGTVGTFLAYALLWRGRLTSQSLRYSALNFTGGLLAGAACIGYGAWPSAAANIAWAALGLHAMIRTCRIARADRGPHRAAPTESDGPARLPPPTVRAGCPDTPGQDA